jgi:hypothetical protein
MNGDVVAPDRRLMKSQNLRFPAFALFSSFGYLNVHKLFKNPNDATDSHDHQNKATKHDNEDNTARMLEPNPCERDHTNYKRKRARSDRTSKYPPQIVIRLAFSE